MTEKKMLDDELLDLVSGGVLIDGWDESLLELMKHYKAIYGEKGYQKVKELMMKSLNDPTSPIEASDMETIYHFIEVNWEKV